MGLMENILKQFRKPTGKFGRFIARGMNNGHSKVTRWGLSHILINKSDIILDIGCGGGKTVNTLAKTAIEGKVYGIDYSEACVNVASKVNKKLIDTGRVKITHASVESLPFPDGLFDLVTAVETYFFWPDLLSNLREIRRVLKPGGTVTLINEGYKHDKFAKMNTKFATIGKFSLHLPEEFRAFLKDAGYFPIKIEVIESKNWIAAIGEKA